MEIYDSSFLIVILRILIIGLLIYILKKPVRGNKDFLFSNFLMVNISKYTVVSCVFAYFLLLINAFNLYNVLLLIIVFVVFDSYKFAHPRVMIRASRIWFKAIIIRSVFMIEKSNLSHAIINNLRSKKLNRNELHDLICSLLIIVIALCSKLPFYKYDLFLFSETWFEELKKVSHVMSQNWLTSDHVEMGEYTLIGLISLFFKLSVPLSLQSFGILQNVFLALLVFFSVKQTSTKSNNYIALLAALIFTIGFSLAPVNLTFLLKHNKAFSVLYIVLPLLITLTKKHNYYHYRKLLVQVFFMVISVALISYWSFLSIVLPAFVLILIYVSNKTLRSKLYLLGVICLGCLLPLLIFYFTASKGHFDLLFFLKNSCIDLSNFTKTQNTIINHNLIISILTVVCLLGNFLNFYRKRIMASSIINYNMFLVITAYYKSSYYLIDSNFIFLLYTVFVPLVIGTFLTDLIVNSNKNLPDKPIGVVLLILVGISLVYFQKDNFNILKKSNQTNREVLSVYQKLMTNHLPYTYAIVSHPKAGLLSKGSHLFMGYGEFKRKWLVRDSIYHKHKKDKAYLKANPQVILPNNVFIFVVSDLDKNVSQKALSTPKKYRKATKKILRKLRSRKRKIKLFSKTKRLKVYQVINKESSSIDEMLICRPKL